MRWIVFVNNLSGHRQEYGKLFCEVLEAKQLTGFSITNLFQLFTSPAVLFSSIDDYIIRFLIISYLRSCIGGFSVAIATRAETVYKPLTLKIWLKRLVYKLIRKNTRIKTVSILPFYVEPRLKEIVDDWIYDPQFWDLSYLKKYERHKSSVQLLEFMNMPENKLKVVLPGKISKRKGAEFMIDIFLTDDNLRHNFSFILGGEVVDIERKKVDAFIDAGGFVLGRSPSFTELMALYNLSDIIWCCYPPTFNLSSGIFGRALQHGIPVILWKESYLSRFNIPSSMKCALEYCDISGSAVALNKFKDQMGGITINLSSADKVKLICSQILCKK